MASVPSNGASGETPRGGPAGPKRISWRSSSPNYPRACSPPWAARPSFPFPSSAAGTPGVWAKLESFNPGGSAKDRTARALVADTLERGVLGPGSVVVESSSGNLGVALAREAAVGGWEFQCVVDPRTNQATLAHMRALGAHIHPVEEPDPETGNWLTA